ncbi:hypothetical protein DMENIID0001_081140 [Sergentomyia squamirostris]
MAPTLSQLFNNMEFDKEISEKAKKIFADAGELKESETGFMYYKLTAFTEETFGRALNLVKSNQDVIAELEELSKIAPKNVTKLHIQKALEIAEYYGKFPCRSTNISQEFIWTRETSIFEILLDLFSSLQACVSVKIRVDTVRNATFRYLSGAFTTEHLSQDEIPEIQEDRNHFGTLFITESCDLQSATDILVQSFNDNTAPWKIRNLLVQESVEERFYELLLPKMQKYHSVFTTCPKFQENYKNAIAAASKMRIKMIVNPEDLSEIRPTIILGQNRTYFDQAGKETAPVIVMNIFRTVKEGVTLLNASNGGSVSVWCENLSVAYEIAHGAKLPVIWINSLAKFTPEIPFNFVSGGITYGSEIAVLEKLLFQKRYGRNNALSPEDLSAFCNHQSHSLIIGGKFHFECLVSGLQPADLVDSNLIKISSDDIKNRFKEILSTQSRVKCQNLASVYTLRKTIVFPFGETFAN